MFAVLLCAVLCADEHKRFIEGTPYQCTDREIVIADARLFGVSREYADRLSTLSWRHKGHFREEVETWNKPHKVALWLQECDDRARCWSALAEALNESWSGHWRISALYRLRELIGPEAFYAGRMPSPIPSYTFLPNR